MDELGYTSSQSAPRTDWTLLPKPRAHAMLQHSPIPGTPNYTTIDESSFEEPLPSTPPYNLSHPTSGDSPSSPEGWNKRLLSSLPKPPECGVFSTQETDGPVKPEQSTTSEKMPARDGRSSPEPNCSICLEKVVNRSFTNGCLHTFCFSCLLQWSKIKAECPLCKQSFKSIIHNVQENHKYDEYHIVPPLPVVDRTENQFSEFRDFITALEVSLPSFREQVRVVGQPFRYSTTVTSDHQRIVYSSTSPWVIPPSDRWPRQFCYRHSRRTNFRKNVYTRDLWAQGPIDVTGRYRECTPEFYRLNPAQVHRLAPWLNRELSVLLNNNLTAVLLDVILNAITRYDMKSHEFHRLILPHLNQRTNHFIHEFYTFARSTFDMVGYDQAVTYQANPNRAMHVVISDDSDSDVLILPSDTAGPSGVNTRPAATSTAASVDSAAAAVDADDSDDCQVVQYVKPRHERTPEIIDLLSDDEEPIRNPTVSDAVPVLSDDSSHSLAGSVSSVPTKQKDIQRPVKAAVKPAMKKMSSYPVVLMTDDSSSTHSHSDSAGSEYLPNKQRSPKKNHKEKDSKRSKRRQSSKNLKHAARDKLTPTKKEKSGKRKSHSHLTSVGQNLDDDLKVLAKRVRTTDRQKIYSSDEAGPSSSYRNHLRSGNHPERSFLMQDSNSSEHWAPFSMLEYSSDEPLSSVAMSCQRIFSTTSEDELIKPYLSFPQDQAGFNLSIDNGFSGHTQHQPSLPLPFLSSDPALSRSSQAASTSSSIYKPAEPQENDRSSSLSSIDRIASHRSSSSSSWMGLCDANLPSTSGMNRMGPSLKRKHKSSHTPKRTVAESKHYPKKSKSTHAICKKPRLIYSSSSPEHHSSQSWAIKPAEVPEQSNPATGDHSSPTTDSSEGRPRLKSIIISRQNPITSSSSYSPQHSRRKHKYKRVCEVQTSSSDSEEW